MSEAGPSKKRQRTDVDDDPVVKTEPLPDNVLPTLVPLDYEDGNVLIRNRVHFSAAALFAFYRDGRIATESLDEALKAIPADGMNGLVQYRVHRGVLASNSTVFADHFRGKQTILTGYDEHRDGEIIFNFTTTNESCQDWVLCQNLDDFLKAIYRPEYAAPYPMLCMLC